MKYNKYCKILLIQNFINNNINATDTIKIPYKNITINVDGTEYHCDDSNESTTYEIKKEYLHLRSSIDFLFTEFKNKSTEQKIDTEITNWQDFCINKIYRIPKDSAKKLK